MNKKPSAERTIRIQASPAEVWEAITSPVGLTNWFPLDATVTPGEGGRIHSQWDDTTWFEERITAWKPGVLLRTEGVAGAWEGVMTEFHIASDAGSTVLRVVSSGFGDADGWEDMHEAFGLGWSFELQGLKHYLEHHARAKRRVIRASARYSGTMDVAWNALAGPAGWLGTALPPAPSRLATRTATGDTLTGDVLQMTAPKQLVARLDQWNNSLLRIQVLPNSIGRTATLWLSTFGVDADIVADVERRWRVANSTIDGSDDTHGASSLPY